MNKDIATAALEMALKAGASDARISLFEGKESSIEMTDAQVENLKESFSSSLNISIFTEGKFGAFYTNRHSSFWGYTIFPHFARQKPPWRTKCAKFAA